MQIEFKEVGKSYFGSWLFKGFNFTFHIKPDVSFALLGRNGSGKSTLARLLCGQVSPTKGTVSFKQHERLLGTSEIHKWYSLSSPSMELPEEFTVNEWFVFIQKLKGFDEGVSINTIKDLSLFSNKTLDKPIYTFSSGMKQRVKLCGAFLSKTPLVVMDEPLSNLDDNGIELYQSLWNSTSSKNTLVVASNDPKEYENVQTKLHIEGGRVSLL